MAPDSLVGSHADLKTVKLGYQGEVEVYKPYRKKGAT